MKRNERDAPGPDAVQRDSGDSGDSTPDYNCKGLGSAGSAGSAFPRLRGPVHANAARTSFQKSFTVFLFFGGGGGGGGGTMPPPSVALVPSLPRRLTPNTGGARMVGTPLGADSLPLVGGGGGGASHPSIMVTGGGGGSGTPLEALAGQRTSSSSWKRGTS